MKGKQSINFEEKLRELEGVVQALGDSSQPLEKSMELFEHGIKLFKECKEFMSDAEKKISVLMENLTEEKYQG